MSKNYNGLSKIPGHGKGKRKNSTSIDNNFPGKTEDILPTVAFRGFTKVPRVLLSRYDITPYLKNGTKTLLPAKKLIDISLSLNLNQLHLTRILQGCHVRLVRENLTKLQNSFVSSSRSDVSASELLEMDLDMATFKCKICDKLYATEKKLHNHQNNKHMIIYKPEAKPQKRVSFSDHIIVHEVKEYHKCRKCTKIFENYKLLKTHMKQRHKKRKCYICHYCNKSFADRTFFKVHIKLHCNICHLLLANRSKYLEHRRNVCRVVKKQVCTTCNCSFFKFMDLKDHSYEHLSLLFICDICKDQFETKCAVAHHIAFLHSKKRPTTLYDMRNLGNERLYLCKFCEESSVEREAIEAHVQLLPDLANRAMTGYKDYYFCDQCLKKFDTEQDMLQHKWSHFLKNGAKPLVHRKNLLNKKKTYNIKEGIPEHMKPSVVLNKLNVNQDTVKQYLESIKPKKTIKKTIFSKHQCQTCGKYYSSNYCLNRHIETQHCDYESLRCNMCEEVFVWPSLLKSHKCIRLNIPEMPFDDARPEIHFDNLHEIPQNGFDDLNIADNDDYMNSVDFEIPAPVVELTEGTNVYMNNVNCVTPLQSLGYKVVMQEVPIEF